MEDSNSSSSELATHSSGDSSSLKRMTSAPGLGVDDGDVLLDYEAEEPDEDQQQEKVHQDQPEDNDDEELALDEKPEEQEDEEDEELEEGEVSDEDEESRKERLKPQPVCRFYSKGQCTWGASCRFVHPGVLDKGNYNMFAPPRPILPNEDSIDKLVEEDQEAGGTETASASATKPSPEVARRPETAWERGLRQAKEMKRLSQQRKETDIEYEEKRTTMSLTQAELDRENDYYTRPASPLHDNDDDFMDDFDDVPRLRRVAPPPPPDFQSSRPTRRYPPLEHHASPPPTSSSRRSHQRYSPSPPPPSSGRIRRVAPPRSPERDAPRGGDVGGPRHRRGDEWADPWMRGEPNRASARKRSYSSGSSRSSSKSSSSRSRSRSPKRSRRRGRSSSRSSRSSRSRSSSPEGIPRRNARSGSPDDARNTAPLQKRLMNLSKIKKEKEDAKEKSSTNNLSAADAELVGPGAGRARQTSTSRSPRSAARKRNSSSSSRSSSSSSTNRRKRSRSDGGAIRPAVPPEEPMNSKSQNQTHHPPAEVEEQPVQPPKPQIRMTLKTASAVSKTVSKNVLEKLGTAENNSNAAEILENAKAKREENKLKKANEIKKEKKEKKEKKSAADRREELLKQLKAVENAIAKKRTKLSSKD